MADPISIMAIAGLVYAGRKLSQPDEKYTVEGNPIEEPEVPSDFSTMEVTSQTEYSGPISPLVEPSYTSIQEMSSFSEVAPQQRSSGGEVLSMRNRMYDTGRMNNLSPIEKQLVLLKKMLAERLITLSHASLDASTRFRRPESGSQQMNFGFCSPWAQ